MPYWDISVKTILCGCQLGITQPFYHIWLHYRRPKKTYRLLIGMHSNLCERLNTNWLHTRTQITRNFTKQNMSKFSMYQLLCNDIQFLRSLDPSQLEGELSWSFSQHSTESIPVTVAPIRAKDSERIPPPQPTAINLSPSKGLADNGSLLKWSHCVERMKSSLSRCKDLLNGL